MLTQKNNEWNELFYTLKNQFVSLKFNIYFEKSIIYVERITTNTLGGILLNSISLTFILVTILLTYLAILSDHNHENEHLGLYNLLLFSTICLIVCFSTHDLFIFYLGFESITVPIYYLIHMYGSDIDKFKACD
jgi:NADH:ubiquinone oxidoreductase subunit 4 (subunit M)